MSDATPAPDDLTDLLRAIVRGEADWRLVDRIGVQVDDTKLDVRVGNTKVGVRVITPPLVPEIKATAADLATGILNMRDRGREFRVWAAVVYMSDFADFEAVIERHPDGDLLGNTLWDASFGNPISDETFEAIRAIARE